MFIQNKFVILNHNLSFRTREILSNTNYSIINYSYRGFCSEDSSGVMQHA